MNFCILCTQEVISWVPGKSTITVPRFVVDKAKKYFNHAWWNYNSSSSIVAKK